MTSNSSRDLASNKRAKISSAHNVNAAWDESRWQFLRDEIDRQINEGGRVKRAEVFARRFLDAAAVAGSSDAMVAEDIAAVAAAADTLEDNDDDEDDGGLGAPPKLFRLASMTKALVSVCTLQWLERGLFALGTPIAAWIPELARPMVVDDAGNLRPARASITVKMLLNHTSGLCYRFHVTEPEGARLRPFYVREGVFDIPHAPDHTSDALLARLARCPLAFEPGTRFAYSLGTDVLVRPMPPRLTDRPTDRHTDRHKDRPSPLKPDTLI